MRRRRGIYACRRIPPALVLIPMLMVALLTVFNLRMGPVIRDMAAFQARIYSTQVINDAVNKVLGEQSLPYADIAHIVHNEQGNVTSIQTDMQQINLLSTKITEEIINDMSELSRQDVPIPIGTMVGGQYFAGRGPNIRFYAIPTGMVESGIANRFSSAGINQTRHQIIMSINVGVIGVIPGYSTTTMVETEICLAETVIVGVVPEYFTQVEGETINDSIGISGYDAYLTEIE